MGRAKKNKTMQGGGSGRLKEESGVAELRTKLQWGRRQTLERKLGDASSSGLYFMGNYSPPPPPLLPLLLPILQFQHFFGPTRASNPTLLLSATSASYSPSFSAHISGLSLVTLPFIPLQLSSLLSAMALAQQILTLLKISCLLLGLLSVTGEKLGKTCLTLKLCSELQGNHQPCWFPYPSSQSTHNPSPQDHHSIPFLPTLNHLHLSVRFTFS